MTDLQRFIELYKAIGIELEVQSDKFGNDIYILECDHEKITGHVGFYTNIKFDVDGKFIEQGFWE